MSVLTSFRERVGLTGDTSPIVAQTAGRRHLGQLFCEMGFTVGAEIGVWTGNHSKQLCESVPGLKLTCVDAWKAYSQYADKKNDQARLDTAYRDACTALAPFGCRILRMTSADAAKQIPNGSLDFVYVDANHGEAYVRQDLQIWAPKVRSGGIVSGHDYSFGTKSHTAEVKPAVDAFMRTHHLGPCYVLAGDKSPSFFWVQP